MELTTSRAMLIGYISPGDWVVGALFQLLMLLNVRKGLLQLIYTTLELYFAVCQRCIADSAWGHKR